ncbi:hypothetical protein [Streptomyces xantholiticus]|uniref:hypothetical protein n=1 Tax=Streptomyces xantholiticus TaxID=68285 RepID=UPI00167A298E|nr:hypothetical protein [Streptomyces xantholiticus]GGW65704.1 hypothetical protein GCM10010381_58540 [Streptomyces xantholiticus]
MLGFLLDFIETHLYDPRSTSQFGTEYMDTMKRIRERLGRIDSLGEVDSRRAGGGR